MYGYLKIFVLMELNRNPRSGYELMRGFEKLTGAGKPSPGSIYPLLNDLLKKNVLSVSKKGNKKIYSLSKKGRETLSMLMEERRNSMERNIKMLSPIYSNAELKKMRKSLTIMSSKRCFLERDYDLLNILKITILDFISSKNYSENRQRFRALLQQTIDKVNEINKTK